MSRWLARLPAKTQECVTPAPAKTDKSPTEQTPEPLLAVLAVTLEEQTRKSEPAANDVSEASAPVSPCRTCMHRLPAGTCSEPVAAGLSDRWRLAWGPPDGDCVAHVSVAAAAVVPMRSSNPYMSKESTDRGHWPSWDDAEIYRFTVRASAFIGMGLRNEADHLAEMLVLRDREGDDRVLCVECQHGRATRCPDGAPMPVGLLHHCIDIKEQI